MVAWKGAKELQRGKKPWDVGVFSIWPGEMVAC